MLESGGESTLSVYCVIIVVNIIIMHIITTILLHIPLPALLKALWGNQLTAQMKDVARGMQWEQGDQMQGENRMGSSSEVQCSVATVTLHAVWTAAALLHCCNPLIHNATLYIPTQHFTRQAQILQADVSPSVSCLVCLFLNMLLPAQRFTGHGHNMKYCM